MTRGNRFAAIAAGLLLATTPVYAGITADDVANDPSVASATDTAEPASARARTTRASFKQANAGLKAPGEDVSGCGVSISGVLGTCVDPNCFTFDAANRPFRGGTANLGTCEEPGDCSVFTAATQVYDVYVFDNPTPDAQCNCLEIDFNTGGCGTSVHAVLYAGVYNDTNGDGVPEPAPFNCGNGQTYQYLADPGSSLPLVFSGELPPNFPDPTAWPLIAGKYSIVFNSNFGVGARGCTYSADITCRATESTQCLLLPLETKLDMLLSGAGGPNSK